MLGYVKYALQSTMFHIIIDCDEVVDRVCLQWISLSTKIQEWEHFLDHFLMLFN